MFEICDSGFIVMKKVLTGTIALMAIALVLGVSWGKLFKRGYTQDEYGGIG